MESRSESVHSGKPYFGIDAPPMVIANAVLGIAGIALVVVSETAGLGLVWLGVLCIVGGIGTAGLMLYSSLRGKIRVREKLLDELRLRGDEDILDIGCGSGLMLVGAAGRLTTGTATGVDLWRARDQLGSSREVCLRNARRQGVEDKVTLVDGDVRKLPFEDGSFDIAFASLAIHNLHPDSERETCIRELRRVLRPGGRMVILDFAGIEVYVRTANDLGMTEIRRSPFRAGVFPLCRSVTALAPAGA